MRLAEQARGLAALRWMEVRYESLAADPARQLRAVCEFMDLDWVPNLTDFAARAQARESATPSTAQLARGLDRSGVGPWRHYQAALAPILPTLQPWVERLGYGA
jgi:hypothetical protein